MNNQLDFTPAEYMTISMARMLEDAENVFMGVASNLPFFAIWLAKKLYNPDLTWLNIPGKVNPEPLKAPKSTVDFEFLHKASSSLTLSNIFDMSARGELDVAFLSGVQIDKYGNFNLSHIPEGNSVKIQFTGGAGSALICATTKRVIFWRTKHDKRAFVDKCPINTATGNIYKVVSPIAVFAKKDGILNLESINPLSGFQEISENTGFTVNKAPYTAPPSDEELKLLRDYDKEGIRNIEF